MCTQVCSVVFFVVYRIDMCNSSLLITIWWIRRFLTVYTVTGNTIWALKRRRVERVDWRSVRVELGRVINAVILQRKKKEHSALHSEEDLQSIS